MRMQTKATQHKTRQVQSSQDDTGQDKTKPSFSNTFVIPISTLTGPKVIERYQKQMGWVDRHNRFRHDMLALHKIWTTKRWQTRLQLELIAMAVVDTFLIVRKFIPKYATDTDEESSFRKFIVTLLSDFSQDEPQERERYVRCFQIPTGKCTVQDDPNKGKKMTKQFCCKYCKRNNVRK